KPTSAGAIARNDAVNAQRYLAGTMWRRWSGYHRRSPVETNPLTHASMCWLAMDALYETTRAIANGEGFWKAGRGDPNPYSSAEPLHFS
ncbi:MAG: hypothetical protein ACI9TA_003060, partial [Reinekea sp.]